MARFYDTILAQYIKNPGQRWLWLDTLADKEFNYTMISYDDITSKKTLKFEEVELTEAAIYSGEDVYMTYEIYKHQQQNPYITQELKKWWILESIEFPLMYVLSDMEMHGIKIQRDQLKWLWMRLEAALSDLEKDIYSLAWEIFNINSPKQVWEVLFEKLWYPTAKKTKTGFSVNSEVLDNLAKSYPIASKIVQFRHYSKLRSTYVEWLLNVTSNDNRIHTSYNQIIASTWRLSSTNPNLQNIPTWDDVAGEIRSAFIADSPWDLLVAFDYSQVEVRLLAIMSKDENLLKAFKEGRDIHQVTWEFIFKTSNITSTQRKVAKAVNFWVIYWISPFWLTKMIDISQKEAREYIDAFYENYPRVREFYDATIQECKKKSYVETLFWRRRYIPAINDKNKMIASWAEREAINMPIQWSSADIIKIAMIQISAMLKDWNYKSTMLLQVHDELVFNIVPNEYDELIIKIPKIMESILPEAPIELKVDSGEWKNWKECK